MARGIYYIVNEFTEDRLDEVETLEEAITTARELAKDCQAGDPVSISLDGRVLHQFVLTPQGEVLEESIG